MSRRANSSLFVRKPIDSLIRDMGTGNQLKRALGPVALTSLGIGATIGAGIYVLTGEVAAKVAGPSLMLSFLLAAVGCGFAALCYSEMASMVPVAGSAYTYAYATLGELIAWIIGWDLLLEYAIGSAAVANGWSSYFTEMSRNLLGWNIDPRLLSTPFDYDQKTGRFFAKMVTLGSGVAAQAWINLPAVLILAAITVLLVIGIKESAGFNAAMVILNIGVILTIIGVGSTCVDPANWRPFFHKDFGWRGVTQGAAQIFFAYIGFDSISTNAEEARNPKRDMAIGIIASLFICTVLYIGVAAVLTGMVPYELIDINAPLASAFRGHGKPFATSLITIGILTGVTSSLLVGTLCQPRILMAMARDGLLPESFFADIHPRFQTPWKSTILVGVGVAAVAAFAPLRFLADLVSIGTLFAFLIVCAAVWILRYTSPEIPRPFRVSWLPLMAGMGILFNGGMMFSLGRDNWLRLIIWLVMGLCVYFAYGRSHSKLNQAAAAG